MKPTVLITRPVFENVLEKLAAFCEVRVNRDDRTLSPSELTLQLRGCQGVLCQLTDRMDGEVIRQASQLRVISNIAVGYDNIDLDCATERGILVTNTPGILTETTADLAFGLLLAAARRIAEADHFVRSGQWKEWKFDFFLGLDVHHRTLGIVGLGRIGQAVARRANGFAMNVLYAAPRRARPEIEEELGARHVPLETLLQDSDFVSLHVPLKPETRGLIEKSQLALMKPTAILVNTARGPVVDEAALVDALGQGKIQAAGLDVFEHEPRIHPRLLSLPNVVLAPHIGSASRQTRLRMAEMAADNLIAGVNGQIPPNVVNRELAAGLPRGAGKIAGEAIGEAK